MDRFEYRGWGLIGAQSLAKQMLSAQSDKKRKEETVARSYGVNDGGKEKSYKLKVKD